MRARWTGISDNNRDDRGQKQRPRQKKREKMTDGLMKCHGGITPGQFTTSRIQNCGKASPSTPVGMALDGRTD